MSYLNVPLQSELEIICIDMQCLDKNFVILSKLLLLCLEVTIQVGNNAYFETEVDTASKKLPRTCNFPETCE